MSEVYATFPCGGLTAEIRPKIGGILKSEQYEIVSGADHFWWGHEKEVAEKVASFFAVSFA